MLTHGKRLTLCLISLTKLGPPQADQHGTYAPSALKHRLSQADQTVHRKFNPN
uniref:Uncharacterized protein n=1 Tax=Vitis vinifera TaxID=29760 RepID=F6I1C3_VITVI